MPHRDSHRHRGPNQRPINHRIAGGHHRNNDGCFGVIVFAFGGLIALGAGISELVKAVI